MMSGTESGQDARAQAGRDAHAHAGRSVNAEHGRAVGGNRPGWLFWLVVALFALLYAQDLFQAVTDAFGVPADLEALNRLRAEADQPPIPVPWLPIVVNLLLPPVAFGVAFLIARRRSILVAVLVFALGLAVVAALTLDMYLLAGLLVT